MVIYSPLNLVKDASQVLIVPLFDEDDIPILGVVGGDLTAQIINTSAVSPVVIGGALTPWTELGDGYYTLGMDGATFFNEIGFTQLEIRHATALPVRYLFAVNVINAVAGVFYDVVRDSLGNPIPDVEVAVYEHLTTNLLYTVRTYTNGEFSIPLSAVYPVTLVDVVFTPVGQPSFRRDGVLLE